MNWGSFGMINNYKVSQRVVMATNNNVDKVWDDIFDSLVLNSEPPQQYVKKVTITTNSGNVINMSAQDFSALLEYERNLPPGVSDIQSARMSLDFGKIKRDVDKWAEELLNGFDFNGKPGLPKFPKPKATNPKRKPATKAKPKIIKPKSNPTE